MGADADGRRQSRKGVGRSPSSGLLLARLRGILGEPSRTLSLVSNYFVPTRSGAEAFIGMAGRGVDVTILTNALEATDVPIVHAGYGKWRKPLLQAGVRLFELRSSARPRPRRRMEGSGSGSRLTGSGAALHGKTFVVDDQRVFVGSFNFDPRSAHLNTELGFVIESASLAERMRTAFDRFTPNGAYEVMLSQDGALCWIERGEGGVIRRSMEPGTSRRQRAFIALLSLLPIEWLL